MSAANIKLASLVKRYGVVLTEKLRAQLVELEECKQDIRNKNIELNKSKVVLEDITGDLSRYYKAGDAHKHDVESIWAYVNEMQSHIETIERGIDLAKGRLNELTHAISKLNKQTNRLSEFASKLESLHEKNLLKRELFEIEENILARISGEK